MIAIMMRGASHAPKATMTVYSCKTCKEVTRLRNLNWFLWSYFWISMFNEIARWI